MENQEAGYARNYNTKPVGEFNLLPRQTTGILYCQCSSKWITIYI